MKKWLCILINIVIIFSCASCTNFSNSERISVEETEKHFNKYVQDIEDCIEYSNIDDCNYFDSSFEDGWGKIYMNFKDYDIGLNIYLYNDIAFNNSFNLDELGYEKYAIFYENSFSNIDDMLNDDNSAFKIIQIILSNVEEENLTETDMKELLTTVKKEVSIPVFDYTEPCTLAEISILYRDITVRYYLYYRTSGTTSMYIEHIKFEG